MLDIVAGVRNQMSVTKNFVKVLDELTKAYVKELQFDFEAFAKHARRGTVQVDDVKLCMRKCPDILDKIDEYVKSEGIKTGPAAVRKKKTADKSKGPQPREDDDGQDEGNEGMGVDDDGAD